jgi:hypothetical protein
MLGILQQMGIGYAQGNCLGSAGPEPGLGRRPEA